MVLWQLRCILAIWMGPSEVPLLAKGHRRYLDSARKRERRESHTREREREGERERISALCCQTKLLLWLKCDVWEDIINSTQSLEWNKTVHTLHVYLRNVQVSGWKDPKTFCFRGVSICRFMKLENVQEVEEILGEENRFKGRSCRKVERVKNHSLKAQRRRLPVNNRANSNTRTLTISVGHIGKRRKEIFDEGSEKPSGDLKK